MLVPKTRTIVTLEALVPAFAYAFERAHGELPEVVDCAIIVGKNWMECGRPTPSQACWVNNVGNIRGRSPTGRYCLLAGAYEIVPANAVPKGWHVVPNSFGASVPAGKVCVLPDDSSKQEFRAYETLDEACADYVQVLGARFGRTWRELAERGTTPEEFVAAMKADSYFTGDVVAYTKTVASIAREVLPRVASLLARAAEPGTVELLSRLDSGPATFLRAGEGEHAVKIEDVEL